MIIRPLHVAWAGFEPKDLLPSFTQIYTRSKIPSSAHVLPYVY